MQSKGMVYSVRGQTCRRAGKTVKSLDSACHVSALLEWGSHREAQIKVSALLTTSLAFETVPQYNDASALFCSQKMVIAFL